MKEKKIMIINELVAVSNFLNAHSNNTRASRSLNAKIEETRNTLFDLMEIWSIINNFPFAAPRIIEKGTFEKQSRFFNKQVFSQEFCPTTKNSLFSYIVTWK